MTAEKFKRKLVNLNVKRRLQLWLLIRIGGIIILTSIISALILYGYARHETINTFYQAHIKIRRVSDLLLPVVLSGSAISLISGALLALFLPQKIAGPLYRIEQELTKVKAGDFRTKIKLRTKDTLVNFASEINDTIATVDHRLSDMQKAINSLDDNEILPQDTREKIDEVKRLLNDCKTTLNNH
ncbi:methyl-accepting chemotaxis protein [uncultured Desulfuromonas sp.]|uniref:methyl-accepting chemotaxis protein n=1 Tax=uncultured Desulfuromonas sp. TaxID=181013 RepID=UPI002AAA8CA3|nr:methyl-accepting chemotaxis protein [uncultured Desulfuromonas sp.]